MIGEHKMFYSCKWRKTQRSGAHHRIAVMEKKNNDNGCVTVTIPLNVEDEDVQDLIDAAGSGYQVIEISDDDDDDKNDEDEVVLTAPTAVKPHSFRSPEPF